MSPIPSMPQSTNRSTFTITEAHTMLSNPSIERTGSPTTPTTFLSPAIIKRPNDWLRSGRLPVRFGAVVSAAVPLSYQLLTPGRIRRC